MAWHKFATIKTDGDGNAGFLFYFDCASAQGVNYEIHEVAETKPDTISAIYSGSSSFDINADELIASFISQSTNTSYDLWLDLTTQIYTGIGIFTLGAIGNVPSVNLSHDVLDVATYGLSNIGLTSITGIAGLINLNSLNITSNSLSASNMDAIINDLWDYAYTNAKTGGTFTYATGNDALSTTSGQIVDALEDSMQWNSGTGVITNITNIYELQAIGIASNLGLNYTCGVKKIDASSTATWNDGAGFVPIGTIATRFTGTLDGKGCKVIDLFINRPSTNEVGLFGASRGAVKNIGVENAEVKGVSNVAIIIGYNQFIGGVIGFLENVYATGSVVASGVNIGLVCGRNDGYVLNFYGIGNITGTEPGVIGTNETASSRAINGFSYSEDLAVIGRSKNSTLTSLKNLIYQYPQWTGSEFTGRLRTNNGVLYESLQTTGEFEPGVTEGWESYWRIIEESQITTLTAAEFRVRSNFTGFDFIEDWRMGKDYPELRAFWKRIKQRTNRIIKYLYTGA